MNQPGDVDQYGRVKLDDRVIPDPNTAPPFGRWRGGLIHPDRPRYVISVERHENLCPGLGGWVSSTGGAGKWWGLCSRCHPRPEEGQ